MNEDYRPQVERRQPKWHRASDFEQCPRYARHELTKDQIIEIATEAVAIDRAQRNEEIGRFVTSKFYMAIGMIAFAAWAWLTKNGYLR